MTRPPLRTDSGRSSPAARGDDLPDDGLMQDLPEDESEESALPIEEPDVEAAPETVQRGVEVIRAHERHAPNGPGVYRMIGDRVVVYLIVDGRRDMQTVLARRLLGA